MCEYCEHFKTIAEINEAISFIHDDNLVLQDKTNIVFSEVSNTTCYQTKCIKINYCPFCGEKLSEEKHNRPESYRLLENEKAHLDFSGGQVSCLLIRSKTTLSDFYNMRAERWKLRFPDKDYHEPTEHDYDYRASEFLKFNPWTGVSIYKD